MNLEQSAGTAGQQMAFEFAAANLDRIAANIATGQPPLARSTDPSTSHGAADQAKELQARHHRLILECLREHGPMGKDGIAARTALTGVQVCRRTYELYGLELIRDTGRKAKSTAGRDERVWEAV